MPQYYHLWPDIDIGGQTVSGQIESMLEQVIVDHHQHLPDMFAITFRDPARDVINQLNVNIGSAVVIKMTPPGGTPETLITGEVTGFEAEYDANHLRTILRGYDLTHRLHRGRNTQTYKNVTDSDIVRQIVSNASVPIGQIDSTSITYDHVSQANMSDWAFIKARAGEAGYETGVDSNGQFYFRQPVAASGAPQAGDYQSHTDPLQLVFGDDLIEFRPRITSAEQASTIKVRGWDPVQKQVLIGSTTPSTVGAAVMDDPSTLASQFGSPTHTTVDRPLNQQPMVDGAAAAIAEIISGSFAEADGIAHGNPKLKAGTTVSIGVVGDHFEGKYTLTGTRHVFGENGYRTHFLVSGRQDRSLLGLASLGATNGHASSGGTPINGVVIAQVTDNNDPNNQARVKLKFPWLDDNYESDWARVTQLGAGPNSGALFMPEVNDEVLVAFEFGDIRHPYVVGSLYNGQDTPNLGSGLFNNGKVARRGFVSRVGHMMLFFDDDDNNKKGIALISSDGNLKISLNETNSEIHISSQGKVHLECQQDMTLESQANIKLSAQQGLSLEAGTNLDLKGTSGATLDGGPQLEMKSSGQTKVSGTMVDVNNGALQVM